MADKEQKRSCFKCGSSPLEDGVKLFRFPNPGKRNLSRCDYWAKFVFPDRQHSSIDLQRKLYSEHRMLCERHFKDEDFVDISKKLLSKIAVPCDLGVSNHVFPNPERFPETFKIWVDTAGGKLETPEDYNKYRKMVICDIHFESEDKNRNNRLNAIAVPRLYLPGSAKKALAKTLKEKQDTSENTFKVPAQHLSDSSTKNPTTSIAEKNAYLDTSPEKPTEKNSHPSETSSKNPTIIADKSHLSDISPKNPTIIAEKSAHRTYISQKNPTTTISEKNSHPSETSSKNPTIIAEKSAHRTYISLKNPTIIAEKSTHLSDTSLKNPTTSIADKTAHLSDTSPKNPTVIAEKNVHLSDISSKNQTTTIVDKITDLSSIPPKNPTIIADQSTDLSYISANDPTTSIAEKNADPIEIIEDFVLDFESLEQEEIPPEGPFSWQKSTVIPCETNKNEDPDLESYTVDDDVLIYDDTTQERTFTSAKCEDQQLPELTDIIEDLICDICGGSIRSGFRYSCLQCVDVDLCGGCEAKGYHRMHYVLRSPLNADAYEITEMLRLARQVFLTNSIINVSNKDSVEDEIKEEVDEAGLETNENADPLSINERIGETEMQQNSSDSEATASVDEPPAKKTKQTQELVLDSDSQKLDSEHSYSQNLSLDFKSVLQPFVLKKSTQNINNKDTLRVVPSIGNKSVNTQVKQMKLVCTQVGNKSLSPKTSGHSILAKTSIIDRPKNQPTIETKNINTKLESQTKIVSAEVGNPSSLLKPKTSGSSVLTKPAIIRNIPTEKFVPLKKLVIYPKPPRAIVSEKSESNVENTSHMIEICSDPKISKSGVEKTSHIIEICSDPKISKSGFEKTSHIIEICSDPKISKSNIEKTTHMIEICSDPKISKSNVEKTTHMIEICSDPKSSESDVEKTSHIIEICGEKQSNPVVVLEQLDPRIVYGPLKS